MSDCCNVQRSVIMVCSATEKDSEISSDSQLVHERLHSANGTQTHLPCARRRRGMLTHVLLRGYNHGKEVRYCAGDETYQ